MDNTLNNSISIEDLVFEKDDSFYENILHDEEYQEELSRDEMIDDYFFGGGEERRVFDNSLFNSCGIW